MSNKPLQSQDILDRFWETLQGRNAEGVNVAIVVASKDGIAFAANIPDPEHVVALLRAGIDRVEGAYVPIITKDSEGHLQ